MCLISIAGKGTDKYSDFFLNAIKKGFISNTDGSGFAYKIAKTGAVYFHKGFYDFAQLLDELKRLKIKEEDELVVHSRTATYGEKTKYNTHPFILNPDVKKDMENDRLGPFTTPYPVMFHNGSMYTFRSTDGNSDTYNFANNFMRTPEIYTMFVNDVDKFEAVFKNIYIGNRFAFLSRNHEVKRLGEGWINHSNYWFSNAGYRNYGQTTMNIVQKPEVKDIKLLTLEPITLNTVKITPSNFDEFIIEAKGDCKLGVSNISKGDKYFIKKYVNHDKTLLLEKFDKPSDYKFGIDVNFINSSFNLIPKEEHAKKYTDLVKLHTTIPGTKSSVKKIFNNFKTHTNRRHNCPTISLKYKDTKVEVSVVSALMYLIDYQTFLVGENLKELGRKIGHEHIVD